MDFKAGNQGGTPSITKYKTKDSDFGLIVSNTVTVYGQTLVLKALSNAEIYKTTHVNFYTNWTDGVTSNTYSLGTSTFVDNIAAVLVVHDLEVGINNIYASWEGEGVYAAKSTIGLPTQVLVNPGNPIGGNFYLRSNPASGNVVAYEGSIQFTAEFTTSTQVTGNIRFYDNGIALDSVAIINNQATLTVPYLTAGVHKIQAAWPGAVINGHTYSGVNYTMMYTVLAGTYIAGPLTLSLNSTHGIVSEGTLILSAHITYSYSNLPGSITFFKNDKAIGTVAVNQNFAQLTINNNYPVGQYIFSAFWNGNLGSVPSYLPLNSNTATWAVYERETIPSISLAVSPEPSVARVQDAVLTATLNTSTRVYGAVNFYSSLDNLLGTATIVNNVATLDTYALSTGTHVLNATYSGSNTNPKYYPVASSAITHVVNRGYDFPYSLILTTDKTTASILTTATYTITNNGNVGISGPVSLNEIKILNTQTGIYSNVYITDYVIRQANPVPGTKYVEDINPPAYFSTNWKYSLLENLGDYNGRNAQPGPLGDPYFGNATHAINVPNSNGFIAGAQIVLNLGTHFGYYQIVDRTTISSPAWDIFLYFAGGDDVLSRLTAYGISVYQSASLFQLTSQQIVYQFGGCAWYWHIYQSPGINITRTLATGQESGQLSKTYPTLGSIPTRTGTTSTYWKTIETPLATGIFNNQQTRTFTIDVNSLSTGTSTHLIQANWEGGFSDGGTPYLGKLSNVITQTVTTPTITLSSNANPNLYNIQTLLSASVSGSSVNGKVMKFREDNTIRGTVLAIGNTATLVIPGNILSSGTHYFTASLDDYSIVSNTLTQVLSGKRIPSISLTFSTSTYYGYNVNGILNTSMTANIRMVGQFSGHGPTGIISLYDNTSNQLLGTGTLFTQGSTSTANISWNPYTFNQVTDSVRSIRATYVEDDYNLSTISTGTYTSIRKYPMYVISNSRRKAIDNSWYRYPTTFTWNLTPDSRPTGQFQMYTVDSQLNKNNIASASTIVSTSTATTLTFAPVQLPQDWVFGNHDLYKTILGLRYIASNQDAYNSFEHDNWFGPYDPAFPGEDDIINTKNITYNFNGLYQPVWDIQHFNQTNIAANIQITGNALGQVDPIYTNGKTLTIEYRLNWNNTGYTSYRTATFPLLSTSWVLPYEAHGNSIPLIDFIIKVIGIPGIDDFAASYTTNLFENNQFTILRPPF